MCRACTAHCFSMLIGLSGQRTAVEGQLWRAKYWAAGLTSCADPILLASQVTEKGEREGTENCLGRLRKGLSEVMTMADASSDGGNRC